MQIIDETLLPQQPLENMLMQMPNILLTVLDAVNDNKHNHQAYTDSDTH